MLVTTVATLAVAAVALLGPLEQSLRKSALTTLEHDLPNHPTQDFENLDLQALTNSLKNPAISSPAQTALQNTQQKLVSRLGGGFVYLLGYPNADGQGQLLLRPALEGENAEADSFDDVAKSFQTGASNTSFGTIGNKDYVRMTFPFTTKDHVKYVLAVRRPIDEIPGAVRTVKNAFITAALAGLALTLILAIPLAMTVVRRLRHLRQAALRLAQEGPTAPVPEDRARDEVGDLARTFAIMQRRLQHQEEARRAFVATASHELRTPLTSLDGMLELLDDDLRIGETDLDEARALLARARAQSRRLGRLAADLLDLSRLDAEVRLRSEPVELGELCRAVLAEFELPAGERGIAPVLEVGQEPVWALGDPGSVARIVRILLDNAVRASPAGKKIKVVIHGGSPVALSVCDRGPGIPPEDREVIFRRFQRGRDTAGGGGFGLGLAIGRELAERMGGELSLDPSYGPGARFTLTLPAARAPQEQPLAVR